MNKRLAYPLGLILSARRCDLDVPRTPYAAAKEERQAQVQLMTRRGRQYVVRAISGEGMAILANQRSW